MTKQEERRQLIDDILCLFDCLTKISEENEAARTNRERTERI